MPHAALRLSKSRYLAGLQCHKQLWWRVRARTYVPCGDLIDVPFYQYDNKVAATRELLERAPPAIYEAWFLADETYAGVDILERGPRGYGVIEVKATNSLKPEQ